MSTAATILQLYHQHQLTLPFAVRKTTWSPEYYVIVEGLDYQRNQAIGVPTKQGQLARLFLGYAPWRQEQIIPQANQRVWQYVPEADLRAYQPRTEGQVYELHHRLFWGKYKGWSLEEICQENLGYVEWAIEQIPKTFCISEAAVESLRASGLDLDPLAEELNQAKLVWYAHGLEEEYLPADYWYLLTPVADPFKSAAEMAAAWEKYRAFIAKHDLSLLDDAALPPTPPPE